MRWYSPLLSLLVGLCLPLSSSAQAQQPSLHKEVRVSAPTRLDWKFVASGFGADAAKLPGDYDSRGQKYLLYVPKGHDASKPAPLVLFISPGDGPAGWPQWQKTCDRFGILFCSPYAAGNNCPVGQRTRIVLDALDDVRRQHAIDPDQTYISGFSGGGRMSCAIGYRLPEYFGGIIPVCGTNPVPGTTYLRHRIKDRLSVAFVTGGKDFNRKENEVYMAPFVKELGIRAKLWVVPNMGHAVPGSDTLTEVFAWLQEDLERRRADRKGRPGLQVSAKETPTAAEQADRMLRAAKEDLQQPGRVWRGVALLQGVRQRWPMTDAGKQARKELETIQGDDKLLKSVDEQGGADERRFLLAQAKGLERFGAVTNAVKAWQTLAKHHPDTPEGRQAAEALKRLRGEGNADRPQPFLGFTLRSDTLAVGKVIEGGPAARAGLKPGDVLVKLNDTTITSLPELARAVLKYAPGDTVTVHVRRDGRPMAIMLILGERPKNVK